MSQPWNVGTPPSNGSPPIGSGGQYYPGSPEDNALRQKTAQTGLGGIADTVGSDIGSAIVDAFKGAAGPITAMFGIKEASLINTMNQIFNTAYYGLLALAGGLFCAWGLYEVGKDAGINVGSPLSSAAGVASTLMPEFRGAKAVAGKVSAPKVSTPKGVKEAPAKVSKYTPEVVNAQKKQYAAEFKLRESRAKTGKAKAASKPAKSSGPGERESAARKAGMGAAQILRARREDAA